MRNTFVLIAGRRRRVGGAPRVDPGSQACESRRVGREARASADLPLDLIKLPPGFKIEVYASGVANAREMTLGPKGTVFVGSRNKPAGDTVYALVDKNGDHKADQVLTIAKGLNEPNGVAFHNGIALRRRDQPHRPLRQHRVDAGVAGRTGRRQRRAAEGHAPRAEVHRLRTGRPALRAGRRALQHLRQREGRPAIRVDPPDEAGRLRRSKSSPAASATPSASTGIRGPASSGSPTTAATTSATTCRATS